MLDRSSSSRSAARRGGFFSRLVEVAVALGALLAQSAAADPAPRLRAPDVPPGLEAPEGARPYLVGHAVGTQNYACLPSTTSATGFAWTLFTPQAVLFGERGEQLTTHFFSPNPEEGGVFRPTWQHSRDTSSVWVKLVAPSSDPAYVAPGAIPWLLLEVTGALPGPRGRGALTGTTYIQRVATAGGTAPASGCAALADVGKKEIVPYTADYVFYAGGASD